MSMNQQAAIINTAAQRLKRKQELAKVGMTVTLTIVTISGFMRGRRAKKVHVWTGIGLIGFSFWHHRLYQPDVLEREIRRVSEKVRPN